MKVLVFGATGPMGLLFVQKSLDNGHILTLYVRNLSRISDTVRLNESVKIIEAELDDEAAIAEAVAGQDIIVSCLGPNSVSLDPDVFANAYKCIFAAMRSHGVSRILALGTISIHDPKNDRFALPSALSVFAVRTVARSPWKAIVNVGTVFAQDADGLQWTLYRVGGLADGAEGEMVVTNVGGKGYTPAVRRADVARWLVTQCDEYDKDGKEVKFVGEMPLLCSKGSTLLSWRPGFGRILGLSS